MSIHVSDLGMSPVVAVRIEASSQSVYSDLSVLLEQAERSALGSNNPAFEYISRARALLSAPACTAGGLAPWQIKRIERYIAKELATGITLIDLADEVRLSPSYFCKAFKKSFGTSPLAHVQIKRIERAKDLMLTSNASLADIAFDCGLCDQAHFSRIFRKTTGMSPSQWRKSFTTDKG